MSTITKKQTALALVAVVFATVMVASIAASADQMAFARYHHHHHHHHSGGNGGNSITVASEQRQSSNCQTAGGTSPITASCLNAQTSSNSNTGGIISN